MYILAYLKCGAHHKSALWVLSSSELPQKCQNSSKSSVNVSVQLEMTHIHSSTTITSLVYSHYQHTGALWVFRGSKIAPKMSKFIRNIHKCECTARNDLYTFQYHKYILWYTRVLPLSIYRCTVGY